MDASQARALALWPRLLLLLVAIETLRVAVGLVDPSAVNSFLPWPASPLNARFIASLYGCIGLTLLVAQLARSHAEIRILVAGIFVATSLILVITLARLALFPDEVRTFPVLWVGFYILDPVLTALTLWRFGWREPTIKGSNPAAAVWIGAAVVLGALGVFGLFAPSLSATVWPWTITQPQSQLYSAFFIAFAASSLLAAREPAWARRAAAGTGAAAPGAAGAGQFAAAHRPLPPWPLNATLVCGARGARDRIRRPPGAQRRSQSLERKGRMGRELSRSRSGPRGSMRRTRLLQAYLWLLMVALLVQGAAAFLITGLQFTPPANALLAELLSSNPPHAAVHIVWGAAGVIVLLLRHDPVAAWWLAISFGIFYTLLGVLGVAVHDPFGLRLGLVENSFHLFIGPLTVILAVLTAGPGQPEPDPLRGSP